ncbi:MAG: hypothetical protein E7160_01765 [Firmicutes bacterium]|nr:hypothetical protein [Bacillota bacterium]
MKKRHDKKQIYIAIIFVLALAIGMGYAFLNSTLNITGNTTIKENTWDVHFENFQTASGSVTATSAGIDTNKTTVNYTVTLQKPGDFYEFTVDAVNKGSIDAMISTVSNTGLSSTQQKYMTYSVTYSDGTAIAQYQALPATTGSETIKVRVEYKKDISASDLPSSNQTVTLSFSVQYVQADGSAIAINHPVCKRATSLHNDGTHTFGNLGSGNTINPGDAFDCDVNGDGTFNAETERFYYVSPLDTNNSYAVLIYYNDVSSGSPSNTTKYAYDANAVSGTDFHGPQTAKLQLPTTAMWKSVSLYSTTRNITSKEGNIKVSNFSYEGYAARLLTYQEVVSACGTGSPSVSGYLDNCIYFLENTSYSNTSSVSAYWLENIQNSSAYYSGYVHGDQRRIHDNEMWSHANMNYYTGVRPAIEVPLSRIQK